MKENWTLVRSILTAAEEERLPAFVETASADVKWLENQSIPDHLCGSKQEALEFVINGHIQLMMEIGALDGIEIVPVLGKGKLLKLSGVRLTAQGHQILTAMRQPTTWNAIKSYAVQTGIGLTASTLQGIVQKVIQTVL